MTAARPVPDTASGLLLRPRRATDAAAPAAAHWDDAVRRRLTDPLDDEAGARGRTGGQRTEAERGERFSSAAPEETGGLTGQESGRASCRVAERYRHALDRVLAPWPPRHPGPGHVHVRHRDG